MFFLLAPTAYTWSRFKISLWKQQGARCSPCAVSTLLCDPWRMTFIDYITGSRALSLGMANEGPVGGTPRRLANWRIKWSGIWILWLPQWWAVDQQMLCPSTKTRCSVVFSYSYRSYLILVTAPSSVPSGLGVGAPSPCSTPAWVLHYPLTDSLDLAHIFTNTKSFTKLLLVQAHWLKQATVQKSGTRIYGIL